jgi:hypothetical protein
MQQRPSPRWPSRIAGRPLGTSPSLLTNRLKAFDPLAPLKAEAPDADGVRRGLVAKVKQLIADGEYDSPDRWAAAEARLLNRVGD